MTTILIIITSIVLFLTFGVTALVVIFHKPTRDKLVQIIKDTKFKIRIQSQLQRIYHDYNEAEFIAWAESMENKQGFPITTEQAETWIKKRQEADKVDFKSDMHFNQWLRNRGLSSDNVSPDQVGQLWAEWKNSN